VKQELDVSSPGQSTPTKPGTLLTIGGAPTRGPVSLLPWFIADPLITFLNAISLQRLRREIERRTFPG